MKVYVRSCTPLGFHRPVQGLADGIVRVAVRWARRRYRWTWPVSRPGPQRRDGVDTAGQLAHDGLVVHPPPTIMRPGVLCGAFGDETSALYVSHRVRVLGLAQRQRLVGRRIRVERYPHHPGDVAQRGERGP